MFPYVGISWIQRRVRLVNRQFSVCWNCDSLSVTSSCFVRKIRLPMDIQTIDSITTIYATIAIISCMINVIAIFHIEINHKNNEIIVRIAQMVQLQSFQTPTNALALFYTNIFPSNSLIVIIYVLSILLVQRQIHYPSPHLLHRTTLTTATIQTTATTGMGVSPRFVVLLELYQAL
jgi:hypothetical protein